MTMGEIADAILNGDFDCVTGEYIGNGQGFPRTFEKGHYNTIPRPKKKSRKKKVKSIKHLRWMEMWVGKEYSCDAGYIIIRSRSLTLGGALPTTYMFTVYKNREEYDKGNNLKMFMAKIKDGEIVQKYFLKDIKFWVLIYHNSKKS